MTLEPKKYSQAEIIDLLRGLWLGDADTTGYMHAEIVVELCGLSPSYNEPTAQWVLNHLEGIRTQDCDHETLRIIDEGLRLWRGRGRPRGLGLQAIPRPKELTVGG